MRDFRIELRDGHSFDIQIEPVHIFGAQNAAVRAHMYRVVASQRERVPIRAVDGSPIDVTSKTDEEACALACEVLAWIYQTELSRVSTLAGRAGG
jgi:hypothetical protein